MLRALFALFAVSLALSSSSVSGASGGQGPWRRYLWLKLVRVKLISFSVCAVWDQSALLTPACRAAHGKPLPEGTSMRLEQRRVRPTRSAGWKTVGISGEPALQAVLSNSVSGNRLGVVSYRVTLRNASGGVLGTSNAFRVFWHK
jgi:hypothetical protein